MKASRSILYLRCSPSPTIIALTRAVTYPATVFSRPIASFNWILTCSVADLRTHYPGSLLKISTLLLFQAYHRLHVYSNFIYSDLSTYASSRTCLPCVLLRDLASWFHPFRAAPLHHVSPVPLPRVYFTSTCRPSSQIYLGRQ